MRFLKRITWILWKRKKVFNNAKLVFAFTDLEGNNYHRFENQDIISGDRLGKLKEYYTWLIRGLDNTELDELIHQVREGIVLAMKNIDDKKLISKYLANAIAYTAEIQMRSEKISSVELYYNLLAVQYIRHDEDPLIFSESIQQQKVIAFKAGAGKLDSFFFALPEYERLCKLLNITTTGWTAFQELSAMVQKRNQSVKTLLSARLSAIGSGKENL